jgi:hypothetical protein
MDMMGLIRQLEGQTDLRRREILLEHVAQHSWSFQLQQYSYAGQDGCNIIVDLNNDAPPSILLVAHYDAFPGSPGANDDASAIAVLIDAAEKLQLESLEHHLRMIFFDDEEPTQHWGEPLGSQIYVEEYGIKDLYAVLDFELCGIGDSIAIWPVEGIREQPLLRQISALIQTLKIPMDYGERIPSFYADYLPFRKAGFPDSYCFTCFDWKERDLLRKFASEQPTSMMLRYAAWKFLRLPTIPRIFRHYHTHADRSGFLSTNTLEMMSDLVYRIVRNLNYPPPK